MVLLLIQIFSVALSKLCLRNLVIGSRRNLLFAQAHSDGFMYIIWFQFCLLEFVMLCILMLNNKFFVDSIYFSYFVFSKVKILA